MQTSAATAAVEAKVAGVPGTFDQKECNGNTMASNAAPPGCWNRVENVSTQFPLLVSTRKDSNLSRDHAGTNKNMETDDINMETGRANVATGKEKIETAATKIATGNEKMETGRAKAASAGAKMESAGASPLRY